MVTKRQEEQEILRRKLYYRAGHMGTKELDLLCGCYAQKHLEQMDFAALCAFRDMLKLPDRDLQDILLAAVLPEPLPRKMTPHRVMIVAIRLFNHAR